MKNQQKNILKLYILIAFLFINYSVVNSKSNITIENSVQTSDEIIFHSNGSTFSPVITLQADAEVLWIWDDNTTSNSINPTKNYGSAKIRTNRLKVTPWSALRRINIGFDGKDGGSNTIEFVADQQVSLVENINLVAPNLKEWCSSYNNLTSLDFSNFINLEIIECYFSSSLVNINLTNTPKLRRICLEDNNLSSLNLSDCVALEDLRASRNNYDAIIFPPQKEIIWHVCIWGNPKITNQKLFRDMTDFPLLADLFIEDTNQSGELRIPKSHPSRWGNINASKNHYTSVDFSGAFQNENAFTFLNLSFNELSSVNLSGCDQFKELYLKNNNLNSEAVDLILQQVYEFGTSNGKLNLTSNNSPTSSGLNYKANLEARGWSVLVDEITIIQSITVNSTTNNSINNDNGTLQLLASVLPVDATSKTVTWSVINETGKASISTTGLITAERNGTVKAVANSTSTDGSGIKGEMRITITNQVVPVESITVNSTTNSSINTDNGTLQLLASVLPVDASNKTVTWSVINETGKASISTTGLITAERNGTVKAVANSTDGSGIKDELRITITNQVVPVEKLEIIDSLKDDTIKGIGKKILLNAVITPSDATNKEVFWQVENISGLATIDSNGLLTSLSPGLIRIIVSLKEQPDLTARKEYKIVIPVGISVKLDNFINVFPNPTRGEININFENISKDGAICEIRNSKGQLLYREHIFQEQTKFSIKQYSGNLFFIKILNGVSIFNKKIIRIP